MKRMLALILAVSLLLCACGSKPAETTAPPTTVPETTVPVTTAPPETTVPPTTEATEPAPVDVNPLTGEALDEVNDSRPVAIMINNLSKAVPQCGISQADMIYEIIAEGSVTRFMAIFHDLSEVGVIGPVRSVRPYFYRVAQHYGAILSSAGAPTRPSPPSRRRATITSTASPVQAAPSTGTTGAGRTGATSTP